MAVITLYDVVGIDSDVQTVDNPEAAVARSLRTGLKHLILSPVIGGLVSAMALLVAYWTYTRDPDGTLGVVLSVVLFAALILGGLSFPYGLFCGVRSFVASVRVPDLTTPEAALKAFLASVRSSLPERAWAMLTDQAKQGPRVPMPTTHVVARKLPQPELVDLDAFTAFWSWLGCMHGKAQTRRVMRRDVDAKTVVLTCPFVVDHVAGEKKEKVTFNAEFLLVQRGQGLWFLANSFVWPV